MENNGKAFHLSFEDLKKKKKKKKKKRAISERCQPVALVSNLESAMQRGREKDWQEQYLSALASVE